MPLRLGVLGCGRVFERFHLPAIDRTPSVALIGAADPGAGRLAWAEHRSPRPILAASLDDLLARARLDALLILTPPATHADLAIQALASGLHVLVEKPMALTVFDGRRMADAARAAGRRLQVGHTRRFREPYRRLHARLRGPAGTPAASAEFDLAFPTSGWNAHSGFLGDESRGGSPLDDVLPHQVDLLCWYLGARPDAARAMIGGTNGGAVEAELRFGALTARCHASHGAYLERLRLVLADGQVLEASGSRLRNGDSRAKWGRHRVMLLDRLALAHDKVRGRPNVSTVSFGRQLTDFEHTIRGHPATGASDDDGIRVLEVLDACRRSDTQGGAWVALG